MCQHFAAYLRIGKLTNATTRSDSNHLLPNLHYTGGCLIFELRMRNFKHRYTGSSHVVKINSLPGMKYCSVHAMYENLQVMQIQRVLLSDWFSDRGSSIMCVI